MRSEWMGCIDRESEAMVDKQQEFVCRTPLRYFTGGITLT